MEKQAYDLVKTLKPFRVYILHAKIITYVPSISIKDILIQLDSDGKRGRWITQVLEYDLEIKPTTLIKGHGLARMLVKTNCKDLDLNFILNISISINSHGEERTLQVYP